MSENSGNPFDGAPIIFAYTRAMAIADGVLRVMKEAPNHGWKIPVVCTERVWNALVACSDSTVESMGQWVREATILRRAFLAAKAKTATERAGVPDAQPDRLDFYVPDAEGRDVQLYMLIHPDDDGSFRLYPDED